MQDGWESGLSTSFPLCDYTPGIHLSPWLQASGGCQCESVMKKDVVNVVEHVLWTQRLISRCHTQDCGSGGGHTVKLEIMAATVGPLSIPTTMVGGAATAPSGTASSASGASHTR